MKKVILLLVLFFGSMFLVSRTKVHADYSLPTSYNLTWTVSNPGPGTYEGYSQWVTIGAAPSNIVFIMNNRLANCSPSNYRLIISSVTGGYSQEIDLLHAYNMNFIEWDSITTKDFYPDTRYRFRILSTTAGSNSGMATYLESNSAVFTASSLAAVMSYNDALSYGYGYDTGLEIARESLGYYDVATSTWLGYDDGYDFGYDDGYDVGITEDLEVTSMWSAVIDGIGSIFTLEIFPNVTIGLIIGSFVGFFFIKWFLGIVRG